jgi:prepilin signal peptidase PulO-like enzyme (type II secretory pathway)
MKNHDITLNLMQLALLAILILIAVIDIKEKYINKKLLAVMVLGSIPFVYMDMELNAISAVAAMISIFILLSFIYIVSRKGIGWGDVVLCSSIAPYLGVERAFAMLFISMFLCGITALALLVSKNANKSREIPFAPFAAVGTILVLIL